MQTKSVLVIGALMLGSLGIASAKSYDFILDSNTQVGNLDLKPGHYKVKLDGSNADFMNSDNNKSFTAPVKVQDATTKFHHTEILTDRQNGTEHLQEIDLGGSKTKLEFGQ